MVACNFRCQGLAELIHSIFDGRINRVCHDAGESQDVDLAAAVSQIAEMALLGAGHASQMFPESLDEFNAAYGGETQWRVVL